MFFQRANTPTQCSSGRARVGDKFGKKSTLIITYSNRLIYEARTT
ncbi:MULTISPECIES: hypothetical protein [Bacillus]|nr:MULTISPECIES: hypothetical protein [Bacillus]